MNGWKQAKRAVRRLSRALRRRPELQEAHIFALRDESERLWDLYIEASRVAQETRAERMRGEASDERLRAATEAYETAQELARDASRDFRDAERDRREARDALAAAYERKYYLSLDEVGRFEWRHDC